MSHELVVICTKKFCPAHDIEDAVYQYLKEFKDCVVLISLDKHLDVQGHTFGDKDTIEIEINPVVPDPILVLGHELVHARQILEGRPTLEKEAYEKQEEVSQFIKNSLAI